MMQFLRKHQKKLFIMIAIMTVASFAFLGNSSNFSGREVEDKKVGETLDGSPIYERQLRAITQFLSMGNSDIMKSDFIDTGLISLLAEKYFSDIQGDFQEKLQKARTATFYSHPQAPFLNAVRVWNQFCPQLMQNLREVQAGDVNAKTFSIYAKLYLDQQIFSPELLRAILLREEQTYSWIQHDYALGDTRAFALFGHHTFEEWFGSRFTDILGKFILNTAAIAEKKGYRVTQKEARAGFMTRCTAADPSHGTDYMRLQLQIAGLDESSAVRLWRQVMLVHRFFQDIEQGVLLDPIPYEQFATFAGTKAHVEVYQLPEPLRLKDFRSMLKLQYYLEAVSPKGKQSIADLPRQFYSTSDVEKKYPQLVTRSYELEVAKATQENILSRLSLRKTWDFEISDEGWALIVAEFPVLNKQGCEVAEGREHTLDACDFHLRKKIDELACQSVLKQHPEWTEEALAAEIPNKMVVHIRSKGAVAPFDDIEDTSLLEELLQKAEIGETVHFTSVGGRTHYRIKMLQKSDQKQIMTLKEALEHDWLGALLDEKLEAALVEARKKNSAVYKASDGSWKPYGEVRDHVGAYVYSDLLKMVSDAPLTYDEYAAKRFEEMMRHAQASIQKENDASTFLSLSGQVLADQWILLKKLQEIKRSDTTELSKAEMFTKKVGSWSSIVTPRSGNVAFFHLLERKTADLKVHDQVTEGQRLLGRDVARQKIQNLLTEVGAL